MVSHIQSRVEKRVKQEMGDEEGGRGGAMAVQQGEDKQTQSLQWRETW